MYECAGVLFFSYNYSTANIGYSSWICVYNFYPLSVILHLLGFGGILDEAMLNFLNFALPNYQTDIPFLIFLTTNICAILGVRYRFFAVLCAIFGILPIFLSKNTQTFTP